MPNEHMQDEDAIVSGELSPGAKETEKEIRKISNDRPDIEKEDIPVVKPLALTSEND